METFSALLAMCAGNSPVIGKIPRTKAGDAEIDVFFVLDWINGWTSNGEAGDLRRHRAQYDVTVIFCVGAWLYHLDVRVPNIHVWALLVEQCYYMLHDIIIPSLTSPSAETINCAIRNMDYLVVVYVTFHPSHDNSICHLSPYYPSAEHATFRRVLIYISSCNVSRNALQ